MQGLGTLQTLKRYPLGIDLLGLRELGLMGESLDSKLNQEDRTMIDRTHRENFVADNGLESRLEQEELHGQCPHDNADLECWNEEGHHPARFNEDNPFNECYDCACAETLWMIEEGRRQGREILEQHYL